MIAASVLMFLLLLAQLLAVDASATTAHGPGTVAFAAGIDNQSRNTIFVLPKTATSEVLAVPVELVVVSLSCGIVADGGSHTGSTGTATVSQTGTGQLIVTYSIVDTTMMEVSVSITVCGTVVWAATVPKAVDTGVHGSLVASYDLAAGHTFGIAVTPDALRMVVSYRSKHKLLVYRLKPAFALETTIGLQSSEPGHAELNCPNKMCLSPAPACNILVADHGNNRIQEISLAGKPIRCIPSSYCNGIARHDDILAVVSYSQIRLLRYSTGAKLRELSMPTHGSSGLTCEGLRFSHDGALLFAAARDYPQIVVFTSTGKLLRAGGPDNVAPAAHTYDFHNSDIACCTNGDLLVTDSKRNCIRCYSSDGSVLFRTWASRKGDSKMFQSPAAMVMVGHQLYVLSSARVHVFE